MGMPFDMWNNYKNTGNTSMENYSAGSHCVWQVDTELWAALYGHVGNLSLGMEWWPITGAIFPWKVWKNGAVWQTATCQGHTGWDRLGVPRWSSGKLEQKERNEKNENLPSYEK